MKYTQEEKSILEEYKQKAINKILELRHINSKEYRIWSNKLNNLYIEYSDLVSFQCRTNNKLSYVTATESLAKKWIEIKQHQRKEPKFNYKWY